MSLAWSDDMSVGNAALDHDHKLLIDLLNEVINMRRFGNNRSELQETVRKLEAYAEDHFRREEQALLEVGYPEINSHLELHNFFINKVREIKSELSSGDTIMVRIDLFVFLSEWLTQHIQGSDARYKKYMVEKNIVV